MGRVLRFSGASSSKSPYPRRTGIPSFGLHFSRARLLAWIGAAATDSRAAEIFRLGFLPGSASSAGYRVSDDNGVIVGTSVSGEFTREAFQWTSGTGSVGIGDLPGGIS